MTPQEGKKRVQKLLGKKAVWEDRGGVTSPEARAIATAELRAAKEVRRIACDALEARKKELLAQDSEYQRLLTEYRQSNARENSSGRGGGYRLMAGRNMGFAIEVKAQGDNWADLILNLEANL